MQHKHEHIVSLFQAEAQRLLSWLEQQPAVKTETLCRALANQS